MARTALRKTLSRIKGRLTSLAGSLWYWQSEGYNGKRYWRDRLGKFGLDDLRGVGYLGHSDNEEVYADAANVFLRFCDKDGVSFADADILDVGCGTGFYTKLCKERGATHYTGLDITDVLFPELKQTYPSYTFEKKDVTIDPLSGTYDLIIMIDVTQHIVSPRRFSAAMQNLRTHLAPGGRIIITSWLSERGRKGFYETTRMLSAYEKEFPKYVFSTPVPFRDKYLFSIRVPE